MKPSRNPFLRSASLAASIILTLGQAARADIFDNNDTAAGFGVADAGSYDWWTANTWSNTASVDDGTAAVTTWLGTDLVSKQAYFVGSGVAGENYTVRLGGTGATDTYIQNIALNVKANGTAALTGAAGNVTIGDTGDAGKLIIRAENSIGAQNGDTLTVKNGIDLNGLRMNFRGGNVVINGVVSGTVSSRINLGTSAFGLTSGTLTLANTANTFTGRLSTEYIPANFILAVTKLDNGGSPSSIGTSSAKIGINGGTLKYIGSTGAQTTNLGLNIASGGAIVSADGVTSADTISISGAPTYSAADSARAITLTGTNTGTNKLAFDHGNNGTGVNTLTKNGIGRWVLPGNNSFTGNIAMGTNSGNLVVTNSNSLGTHTSVGGKTFTNTSPSSGSPAGANLLELDNTGTGADIVLSNKIKYTLSGAAGVILNTAGNNTIAGDIGMTTGNGSVVIISNGGTLTLSGTVTANTTRDFDLRGSTTGNVFSGILQNNGANIASLVKSGAGTWTVSGSANTFTGKTKVSAGTLVLTNNLAIQNSVFDTSGAGTLDVTAINTPTFGGLTSATAYTLPSNVTSLTLNNATGAPQTYSGNLTAGDSNMTLTKQGANSQVLSGVNTYAGLTKVTGTSILYVGNAGAIGSGAVQVDAGSRLGLQEGITLGSGRTMTISGDGGAGSSSSLFGALRSSSAHVNEWAGNVTVGAAGTRIGAEFGTLKISGVISGSGTGLFIRANGTGTSVELSGANDYTGDTTIASATSGVVTLSGGANRLPTGTKVIMGFTSVSSKLDLNGQNQEVAGISVGGAGGTTNEITSSTGTPTFTVNTAALSPSTYSGTISGSIALEKKGDDTLTLSGTNAYSGATTVTTGTLLVDAPGSLDAASAVAVNAGTLGGSGTINGSITLASGATLAPGASASIGTLTANGGVTLVSGSIFAAQINTDPTPSSDTLAVTGTLTLGGSTLSPSNLGAATPTGGTKFTIASYTTLSGTFNGLSDGATVVIGGKNYTLDYNDDATPNTITLTAQASGTPYDAWASNKGLTAGVNDGPAQDPDGDGRKNFEEFAFDGNPLSGSNDGKIVGKVATVGSDRVLTLTLPVRVGATFSGATELVSNAIDNLIYTIQGSDQLSAWGLDIDEVTGGDAATIQTGLPPLSDIDGNTNPDWTYRTFRTPGAITADPADFIRAKVETTP